MKKPESLFSLGFVALGCALISACSSSAYKISSLPQGAEVLSTRGEVIGKTPLTLTPDQASKITQLGLLNFKIVASGHVPQVVFVDANTTQEVSIKLVPSGADSFKAEFAKDFSADLNRMLRQSYAVQKLISERKNVEATAAVEKFKAEYPQLAYGYMVSAHLNMIAGKKEAARNDLIRAKALDPQDPSPDQALKIIGGGNSSQ